MLRNQLFRKLIEILKSKSKLEQKPIILPKKAIPKLSEINEEDENLLGHLLIVAKKCP